MPAFKDLTGQRFGRAIVLARTLAAPRVSFTCLCDCGNEFHAMAQSLRSGNTRSCGCLYRESRSKKGRNATHGASSTRTYKVWLGMRKRCANRNDPAYPRYGGRGIAVCERWQKFENFLSDMGECPPGLEIDRIDVNGNYEPSNCKWATLVEQANNKRNNRMVGDLTIAQLARRDGIKYATAYYQHVVRDAAPSRSAIEHPNQLTWD